MLSKTTAKQLFQLQRIVFRISDSVEMMLVNIQLLPTEVDPKIRLKRGVVSTYPTLSLMKNFIKIILKSKISHVNKKLLKKI